jgi:tRNA(fMet)-specific endonuclease VapC
MKWLLDTNIIIHALNGVLAVRRRLNEAEERGEILTSAVVVGELIYGAECSARCEENRENIRRKLERIGIVPLDARVADRWGTLKSRLRARGRGKADIDLLIAATAVEQGAILVTDDAALLAGDIPDLTVENWASEHVP